MERVVTCAPHHDVKEGGGERGGGRGQPGCHLAGEGHQAVGGDGGDEFRSNSAGGSVRRVGKPKGEESESSSYNKKTTPHCHFPALTCKHSPKYCQVLVSLSPCPLLDEGLGIVPNGHLQELASILLHRLHLLGGHVGVLPHGGEGGVCRLVNSATNGPSSAD